MKIDHIGIAVRSLSETLRFYQEALGLNASGFEDIADQGVRVAMLPVGESRIELLEPLRADSPVEKFMAKRGEGIHHIAIQVGDLEAALERLKTAGVRLIDSSPRQGAHGSRIAFIHPSSTHGVLLELVEHVK